MSASSRDHCKPSFGPTERRRMASCRYPSNGKRWWSITRRRTRFFAASSSSPPPFAIDISSWRANRSPALAMKRLGARRAVLLITLAALGIAVAVAWHLTRTVVGPVRRLTQGANAIRKGNFSARIDLASRDELGELAAAFNQMAEDLSEFRRTNIGEVVRAKNTLGVNAGSLARRRGAARFRRADSVDESCCRHRSRRRRRSGSRTALEDLRLDGLDLQAIRTAIGTAPVAVAPADLTRTIRIAHEGGERRLLPRVVPVPALTSQLAGAVLLLYDVTDLVRFDEMRSELVAVASHELQTPLTTLRMTLLMLQESWPTFFPNANASWSRRRSSALNN